MTISSCSSSAPSAVQTTQANQGNNKPVAKSTEAAADSVQLSPEAKKAAAADSDHDGH
jgi:hypothetical protein